MLAAPPKPKYTKEEIIAAALELVSEKGMSALTARDLDTRLVTSARPIFTAFQGFLGYYVEQVGDTLYVGFKFSGLFGIFETVDFDITIPTDGTVKEIVIKTKGSEYPINITEGVD